MKRKIIITSILALVLSVLTAFGIKLYFKSTKYDHVKSMPALELVDIDGKPFNLHNIDNTKASAIIFFNPSCDICLNEAEVFIKEGEQLLNVNMIFITTADSIAVTEMLVKYPLTIIPTAKVLIDKEYYFTATFKPEATPMCYIYDRDKRLLKTRPGEMQPQSIIKLLSK